MSAEKLEAIKQRCAEILAYYDLPELPEWFDEDPYSVAESIMKIINGDTVEYPYSKHNAMAVVIHCKDCKFGEPCTNNGESCVICRCTEAFLVPIFPENHFCGFAKPKGGAE